MRANTIIKYSTLSCFLLLGNVLMAQNDANGSSSYMVWAFDNLALLVGAVVILGVILSLFKMNMMLLEAQKVAALKEHGVVIAQKLDKVKEKSLLEKAYEWSVALIPVGKEGTIDLGHNYDGIRELDNKLPPWWLGIMYGSIIFGVVYLYHYHFSGDGWSSRNEYTQEMEKAEEMKNAFLANSADNVNENTVTALTDELALSEGKSIFIANCAACHGFMGEGTIGPNFTDAYWIHGGGINNVFKVIKYGVPEKGMIAWSTQMGPAAIQKVASYILTLEGTNPPNQKDKEGELWNPEAAE